MRDLTDILSENLLPHVRGPGQYAGCEINARYADVEAAQVAVVLAFPDTYALGISHLGGQVLYHLLNDIPGVACDRTYCPAMDAQARMKEQGIPLFAWESRRALADFDVLGFSLPYELCVTNVLTMLDLAGLPLHAADRTATHPLVIAGDALADTPEPMADFIDVFLPGDGEVTLPALVAAVRAAKAAGHSREQL
ncbi:MAG: B12-binding domain-containing radical SAM protein, partial [Planctomycetota bacterium]